MEKRGIESQRGNENREIKEANSELKALSLVERSMQKDIENIKEDISWNKIHEKNAGIEATLPKLEDNEKALRALQQNLKMGIETAKNMKPTKTSEGRTVEYDLRQIPYFEYHKNKVIGDISIFR